MKRKSLTVFLFLSIFLTSCMESRHLEMLGIIHTRGIDLLEDGQIESTMGIFQFQAQSNNYSKIVSGKGQTVKGSLSSASRESNYRLVPGKLQMEFYSKEIAKKGLSRYLDTLRRDATVPDTMYLAISNESAKEIMMTPEEKMTINVGEFLYGLIEENAKDHHFPKVTLQEFSTTVNISGEDPILPIFSIGDSGVPEITAIAIFSEDKYVGEISIEEMELFNVIHKTVKTRRLDVTLPVEPLEKHFEEKPKEETFYTSFVIENGKSKIKQKKNDKLAFVTEVTLDLHLQETSQSIHLESPDVIKAFEKEISKKLKSRYEKILEQLQEMNADPFGYGIKYRINQENGELSVKEWQEIFPDIKVEFNVDANLVRHGTVDI